FFFVTTRRRHTSSKRDWSSDVCSSDLLSQFVEVCRCSDRDGASRIEAAVLALEPRRNDRPGPVPRSGQAMNTAGGPVSEETTGGSHAVSGLGDVVSRASAPQRIADRIPSRSAVGALPEGTLRPGERTLAADLQVARSSVRAALLRLERLGVVERRRGRGGGTFVKNARPETLAPMAGRIEEFHAERRNLLD